MPDKFRNLLWKCLIKNKLKHIVTTGEKNKSGGTRGLAKCDQAVDKAEKASEGGQNSSQFSVRGEPVVIIQSVGLWNAADKRLLSTDPSDWRSERPKRPRRQAELCGFSLEPDSCSSLSRERHIPPASSLIDSRSTGSRCSRAPALGSDFTGDSLGLSHAGCLQLLHLLCQPRANLTTVSSILAWWRSQIELAPNAECRKRLNGQKKKKRERL